MPSKPEGHGIAEMPPQSGEGAVAMIARVSRHDGLGLPTRRVHAVEEPF